MKWRWAFLLALTALMFPLAATHLARFPSVGRAGNMPIVVDAAPAVVRTVQVYRLSGAVERSVKAGDPIVLQWFNLVSNWLFGLYYTPYRLPVTDASGRDASWFDNNYGGCNPTITFYVSGSTGSVSFYASSLPSSRFAGEASVSDVSNATHYAARITGFYSNNGPRMSISAAYLTLKYCSAGGQAETLFIADAITPPITLDPGELIIVEWVISYGKQCPYQDAFWEAVKPFLGLESAVDYGLDSGRGDGVNEQLGFIIGPEKVPFYRVSVESGESGLKITFSGACTLKGDLALSSVYVYLRSDSNPSSGEGVGHLSILRGDADVRLSAGDTVSLSLTIYMPNMFR